MTAAGVTTLPLSVVPPDPAGSFQSRVPGSTESWEMVADASDGPLRLVVTFILGCDRHHFSRPYRRVEAQYLRRPTVVPPPVPAWWPCVHVKLLRAEELVVSLFDDSAPSAVAAADRLDVAIGPSRLWAKPGGTVRLHAAPRSTVAATLVELALSPLEPPSAAVPVTIEPVFTSTTRYRVAGVLHGFDVTPSGLPALATWEGPAAVRHRFQASPIIRS